MKLDTDFTYDFTTIDDMQVVTAVNPQSGDEYVDRVIVQDEPLKPSPRFWTSLFARFGFNKAFFKYFSHAEVFGRIAECSPSDRLRVCVERGTDVAGKPVSRLLAVSNPTKPIVPYEDLVEMLETSGHLGISYDDGIIESQHRPRVGARESSILGDPHDNRFILATPVDGYGQPNVYLALYRLACSNELIAMSKIFKSGVSLGKGDDNVAFALTRVLDQFNNDEGYAALHQRVESAGQSWASVYETMVLYKLLIRLLNEKDDKDLPIIGTDGAALKKSPYLRESLTRAMKAEGGSPMGEDEKLAGTPVLRAFHGMTGDVSKLYGLANLDALSQKRQRSLPVNCTVYDMLNFATEVATHHAKPRAVRSLNRWVGGMIGAEYDMEGTVDHFPDFADFHVESKLGAGVTGSNN